MLFLVIFVYTIVELRLTSACISIRREWKERSETNFEGFSIVIETVSQLAMALLLDRFLVVLQGGFRLLQGLCSLLFLTLTIRSQLESIVLIWEIVIWLGQEMVIVNLVCFLCRGRRSMYDRLTRLHSTLPSLLWLHSLWRCLCLRILVPRLHFLAPPASEGLEFGLVFGCWLVVHVVLFSAKLLLEGYLMRLCKKQREITW
jgi:hypothetical protein